MASRAAVVAVAQHGLRRRALPAVVVAGGGNRSSITINYQSSPAMIRRHTFATAATSSTTHASSSSSSSSSSHSSTTVGGRCYASAASMVGSSSNNNNNNAAAGGGSGNYISPFQDMFDGMKEGRTFLGTTEFQMPDLKLLKCGIPEHALKFKTTSYGRLLEEPFVRPNEHKITVQVHVRHVPLESDAERLVLKEIVGNRLNDETGVLQLSSSQFGSRIENKRHVVSMLDRVVDTAKAMAARVEEEVEAMEA